MEKERKELYFDKLGADAILELDNRLTELASSDLQGIDQQKINYLVSDYNKIMLDATSNSGMLVSNKQTRNINKKAIKPWFTANCNIKCKNYLKARNLHCRVRTC